MRIATIVRATFLLALVLFVWTSVPAPVRADECPPGDGMAIHDNPAHALPNGPSQWDQAPRMTWDVGAGGGSFDSPGGDATVTVPAGLLPGGTQLTLVRPPLNGLRPGALALRGDGDHIINVGVTDPNQFSVLKLSGTISICFKVEDWEVAQAGAGSIHIEKWNGSNWEHPFGWTQTIVRPQPPSTTWLFCAEVSELPGMSG